MCQLAQTFHALGEDNAKMLVTAREPRPHAKVSEAAEGAAEDRKRVLTGPGIDLQRGLRVSDFPPISPALVAAAQPKELRPPKARIAVMDKGLQAPGKPWTLQKSSGNRAEPEQKPTLPKMKREVHHAEPSQEPWKKPPAMPKSVPWFPALGEEKKNVEGPESPSQPPPNIQEPSHAPADDSERELERQAEALQRALGPLGFPPLYSASRKRAQPPEPRDSKAEAVQKDEQLPNDGKPRHGKKSSGSTAELELKAAQQKRKCQPDRTEPSLRARKKPRGMPQSVEGIHALGLEKEKEKMFSPEREAQPAAKFQERLDASADDSERALEEQAQALERTLESLGFPLLSSAPTDWAQTDDLGAQQCGGDQMDKVVQAIGKPRARKKVSENAAELETKAAQPKRKCQPDRPEPSLEASKKPRGMPQSVQAIHALGLEKEKEKMPRPKLELQPAAKCQERLDSSAVDNERALEEQAEALERALETLGFCPLSSAPPDWAQPKDLGAQQADVDQTDKVVHAIGKPRARKKSAESAAELEPKATQPKRKCQPDRTEPSLEARKKPRGMLQSVQAIHALGLEKEKEKMPRPKRELQPAAKCQERLDASADDSERALEEQAEALERALENLGFSPLSCAPPDWAQPKDLGAQPADVDQTDKVVHAIGKPRARKKSSESATELEPKAAQRKRKCQPDRPEPSLEARKKPRGMPQSVQAIHALGLEKEKEKMPRPKREPQPAAKIQERLFAASADDSERQLDEQAEALERALEALDLPLLSSASPEGPQPKGVGAPNAGADGMDKVLPEARQPWKGKKSSRHGAEPAQKPALAKRNPKRDHAEADQEICKAPRSTLRRNMLQSVQMVHALGQKNAKMLVPERQPRLRASILEPLERPAESHDPKKTHVALLDAGRVCKNRPEVVQAAPPLSTITAVPGLAVPLQAAPSRSMPLNTARDRSPHLQPRPWNHHVRSNWLPSDTRSSAKGAPVLAPQAGAEFQYAQLQFQLIPTAAKTHSPEPVISKTISKEQRSERETMKRQAQRERETAARFTSLGRVNFFVERQMDMEMAQHCGYLD